MKFALMFGNRGFFPESLIELAREQMVGLLESLGFETLVLPEGATKYGAVETRCDGEIYAKFLRENEYDGVILSLPNFGDENGAIAALQDAKVPILVQAYPDEIGKMDFAHRRDAYCGKLSVMDVFYQNGLAFTSFSHVMNPASDAFKKEVVDFAAVCRIVAGMRRVNVGAIGARTTAFKTIRFDEIALQKYGINTETIDLSEVFARIDAMDDDDEKVVMKRGVLTGYSNCGELPPDKLMSISKLGVVLDEIVDEYSLDCIAIRCWSEFEMYLGITPCLVVSELNERGIAAACELDVCNAIAMHALGLAADLPAACLDWNNNYTDDTDKCILFHCGPVPKTLMVADSGHITQHKMFQKALGEGTGWGCNEGRIDKGDITFGSMKTEDGKLVFYIGEGEFTGEEIEKEFFGVCGVAKIDNLGEKINSIGKNGFIHHVSVTRGSKSRAIREAFETYLKYDIHEIG